MINGESESFKLARRAAIFQEEYSNAITRMSNIANNPSISRMIEQINLSSKAISQYSQAWEVSQGAVNAAHQAGLAWNDSLSEIANMVSSPSFISAIKEMRNLSSMTVSALQGVYSSPSYSLLVDTISNIDASSIQSFVDNIPDEVSTSIDEFEQELQNDPKTKAKLEPYVAAMEEVISSQMGTNINLSKGNLKITTAKVIYYIIFVLLSMFGPYFLVPNPTNELIEETIRHNIVEEQYQRDDIELKGKQIKIDEEQVKVNRQILSELKKSNEQKKDSK